METLQKQIEKEKEAGSKILNKWLPTGWIIVGVLFLFSEGWILGIILVLIGIYFLNKNK